MSYWRKYEEEIIEAGDIVLTIPGKLRRPATSQPKTYFGMRQRGGSAEVTAGVVLITKWPTPSGTTMAEPTEIGHAFPVATATVTLTPGHKVYVKCTLTPKEFTSLDDLPSDGAVSFAGGTVTGGLGGKGGAGGYGGGGGQGGGGGGGGGGGSDDGYGTPGTDAMAGEPGNTFIGGGAGFGSEDDGGGGDGGVGTGSGGDGGNGAYGGAGANGAAGSDGEDAPTDEAYGGPTSVDIPAFSAYKKQKVKTKVWEVTAAEIVCIAPTASSTSFVYVPIADVEGTDSRPVLAPRTAGGPITIPEPQVINTTP